MESLRIKPNQSPLAVTIDLPASKSIANRALIINALCSAPGELKNISEARDTQTMLRLLESSDKELDVLDAGTTMRFLTAYLAVTNKNKILTGTKRMCQRPIKILVDALVELGSDMKYLKNEGYPPIHILEFPEQKTQSLKIRGDVSSQYISALLMIAPVLPQGLHLELTGKVGSKPYISMTLKIMETFGAQVNWENNKISVQPGGYEGTLFSIEPDWSAASYWYSVVAMGQTSGIRLKHLKNNSLQGDRIMAEVMRPLGVDTMFDDEGAELVKTKRLDNTTIDFTDCPDLAQTVSVICAVKGVECTMIGLESLRIKETDRINALQVELAKIGAKLLEEDSRWTLIPSRGLPDKISVNTYDDHRMAMAFAPLATIMDVEIDDKTVVNKSYPGYWLDFEKAGFELA